MALLPMKDLRIVFMGTPEFATATLSKLLEESYKVVGVVTAPDRPAGRGRKLQQSDVKKFAISKGLKVLQPTNLKKAGFLEELRALEANLQIVVAFRMLPKEVWAMPEYGTFNLHASLLPDYRGAAPINWAIINGESETGVTTFFIDDKIDTGEIILQEKINIEDDDTAGKLHDKLMHLGASLVAQTVASIAQGSVVTKKQSDTASLKLAPKINRETCKIDWNRPIEEVHNHIRGLSPYPAAWTTLINGSEEIFIKVYGSAIQKAVHSNEPGRVFATKNELKVAVKKGYIKLYEIQLPGKRKMQIQDILNGLRLHYNAHML